MSGILCVWKREVFVSNMICIFFIIVQIMVTTTHPLYTYIHTEHSLKYIVHLILLMRAPLLLFLLHVLRILFVFCSCDISLPGNIP